MSTYRQQHFLIAASPVQSHINPALQLALRLTSAGALVTFSTSDSAHRRMLPSATSEPEGGNLTFIPYPDDCASRGFRHDSSGTTPCSESYPGFCAIILDLAARDRPVTCVIYTILLSWAADVARELGIPSVQYWIQPATAFAAYYHYFHGYESLISSHSDDPRFPIKLPGLPPMQIRDLPSFLTSATSDGIYSMLLTQFKRTFEVLDKDQTEPKRRTTILMNTFGELEPEALAPVPKLDFIPIGPILSAAAGLDLFEQDGKRYMEWLDKKADKSVVYVAFGSVSVLQKEQMEEISRGLADSGRPYLWVVRKDSRWEGVELGRSRGDDGGMVVEWCSQMRVLSHPAVGCFVTHCGWNSTTESLVCGVPTVGVPQWTDQLTNAMLMEKLWGTGVRAEVNDDGILECEELRRCLDLAMGEGERGSEIRRNAEMWKEKVEEAIREGGPSDENLRAFVEGISKFDQICC